MIYIRLLLNPISYKLDYVVIQKLTLVLYRQCGRRCRLLRLAVNGEKCSKFGVRIYIYLSLDYKPKSESIEKDAVINVNN